MKKIIFVNVCAILLCLLFVYTSASKFLDIDKFVFQMRLAPVPFMKTLAPILGWIVPAIEIIIAISLAMGFFWSTITKKGLYASVILLSAFEVYISIMLLSGSDLPCTCGGIISTMGWKEHLLFNGFFITAGILSINYLQKHKSSTQIKTDSDGIKILSRA